MNIYDLKISDLRQIMRQFGSTLYGRTIFLIAYFVPITLFFACIGMAAVCLLEPTIEVLFFTLGTLLAFLITFMIANAYFYHELRVYVEHFRNTDHDRIKKYFK